MPSSTVEDYLKQLYLQQQRSEGALVPTGRLATALGVTPGTATTMVKTLAEAGLVHYEARRGVRLSPRGARLALDVVRRHRLIELFLVRVLGLDWSEVHVEAEALEHAISARVLERIDEMLGHPLTDPHGDPIPTASGEVAERVTRSLAECDPGEQATVARVSDQDPEFLRFAEQSGLCPGVRLLVEDRSPAADSITVRPPDGPPVVLSTAAARRIFVGDR